MKVLKYLFFLVLISTIGFSVYVSTQPDTKTIQSQIVIDAPPEVVFKVLTDLSIWKTWAMKDMDSATTFVPGDTVSGKQASVHWRGPQQYTTLKTQYLSPNDSVIQQFKGLNNVNGMLTWRLLPDVSGTAVQLVSEERLTFLQKAQHLIKTDGQNFIREMATTGLDHLQNEVAKSINSFSIMPQGLTEYGGGFYMYLNAVVPLSEKPIKDRQRFQQVETFMKANNLVSSGPKFKLYLNRDVANNTSLIAAAIPVAERVIPPLTSEVLCGYLTPGSYFKTTLKGNYSYLDDARNQAAAALADQGYTIDSDRATFEIYQNNTDSLPNPADWITEIFIPVKTEPQPE